MENISAERKKSSPQASFYLGEYGERKEKRRKGRRRKRKKKKKGKKRKKTRVLKFFDVL